MKGLIVLLVIGVLMLLGGIYQTISLIDQAGGVKQMVIDAGKEIKEISHEIDKHDVESGEGHE